MSTILALGTVVLAGSAHFARPITAPARHDHGTRSDAAPGPLALHKNRVPTTVQIASMVEQLATVIAAGASPRRAWEVLAPTLPAGQLRTAAEALGRGASADHAFTSQQRDLEGIASLSMALAVCERSGAPTVDVLSALAQALRDLNDAALARRSAFAGPRATAMILLVLPVAGLGLGALLGADPIGFLLSSTFGVMLGAAGIVLTLLGWWWMRSMLRSADPPQTHSVDPSVVMDLIAGASRAGCPPSLAITTVAETMTGDDATALLNYGRGLATGITAHTAATGLPEHYAALSTAVQLSNEAGADLTHTLTSAARDSRRGRAREAELRAAKLGVHLVLPTGLTLLPAFIALGIIPTVIALLDMSLVGAG